MANFNLGYGNGMGDKAYPFYKNFYGGGIGSVRGYKPGTVGPQATNAGGGTSYIGGNEIATGNFEIPGGDPGVGRYHALEYLLRRGFCRCDRVGCTGLLPGYDLSCPTNNTVATSVGLGMSWVSPIGPLKFSLGYPIGAGPGAQKQPFQFTMGSAF